MCVYGVIDDLHHKSVFFKIEIIDMVLDQVQYLAKYWDVVKIRVANKKNAVSVMLVGLAK